jgi:YD repeat-containing protein
LTYEYDALDRITKITDPLGNESIQSFDANGQLWKVTHRYKKSDGTYDVRDVVTRSFDAADRVLTETDAGGNVTSYSYDEAGNVIAVLDAEGHTTRFEYDAMNRRTATVDAKGYRTQTVYDANGNPTCVIDANAQAGLQPKNAYGCT